MTPALKKTDEYERVKSPSIWNWKAAPLTLGLLITLLAASIWIICGTLRTKEAIEATAKIAVDQHMMVDVDRAHPDLSRRYTSLVAHEEIKGDLRSIKESLSEIKTTLKSIKTR